MVRRKASAMAFDHHGVSGFPDAPAPSPAMAQLMPAQKSGARNAALKDQYG
jgi:hypothetical protein